MKDKTRDELLLGMASGIEALLGKCSDDFVQKSDKILLELLAKASNEQAAQETPKGPKIIRQDMEPVKRPETVCPNCGGYMIHKGFELDDARTHIVIHYGCNDCGVHIKQHYSCEYEYTDTDKIPDRETRMKQQSCDHHFLYVDTRSCGISPDCRSVWDNYRCTLCGKVEHRNERHEPTK